MKQRLPTIFIMSARLFGTVALILGIVYWATYSIPLHVHMAFGALFVLAAAGLAGLALGRAPKQAILTLLLALLVPVIGMAQLQGGESRWLLQVLHVAIALGAIAYSEIIAKRLRQA
ncbi:hypothetical protein [Telmatospirillum sp. J64-1]|uniref:hypothetical protein n=1 Tax=Telmatospirillum sp. J64-1 TaxID=2502183 RepID=UPI00115DE33D|nr:hypothetical protein [Telmatospirillum sp. J64-1]